MKTVQHCTQFIIVSIGKSGLSNLDTRRVSSGKSGLSNLDTWRVSSGKSGLVYHREKICFTSKPLFVECPCYLIMIV